MANTVTVHLIRHEKTPANVARRYIGRTNESIIQANARQIAHEPHIVYGSGLKRCEETAKLYFPNAVYCANNQLNELDFGDFEMKTYDELKRNPAYRSWINDPFLVTPPNGESFMVFSKRVHEAFINIVNKPGQYTFVVHGGVIRVLLHQFTKQFATFQDAVAQHHTDYILTWDSVETMKEGVPCTSYSAVYLTEKEPT